ncbi:extracellular solute-binding protein [Dongia rigui]|uniref:Extracellular solute-binding protein n=1 Tax=Dongia rigui TaxID=940149 RepID=A0ABU5E1P9_9PROT|nr:extracellular solute-binding protein [Dongia rigui]MDY0873282.1 extracellular solute-binding protein [Dongia rigui]
MKKLTDPKRYERLLEAVHSGDIDRRSLLRIIGATAAAVGVTGGPMGFLRKKAMAEVDSIRFDGWGGIVSEAFHNFAFPPFTEKTGIKVVEGEFGDTEEFLSLVKAAQPGDYNLFLVSGVYDYARFCKAGFGDVINEANIPNLANVLPATLEAFRAETGGKLSAVPFDYGVTGLAYNRKYISDEEAKAQGVKLQFDEKYKGKIALYDSFQTRIWMASLLLGQDPQGATDINAIYDSLRKQRELVVKYWSSGQEFIDLMAKEEVIISDGWSGRVAALQQDGHDIGFLNNVGFAWLEGLYVLKGSPMEAAEQLLNFCIEPKVAIAIAEGQNYPSSLDPTKVPMTDKIKSLPAYDDTGKFEGYVWEKAQYWYDNQDAYKKEWDRISKGA